ncbi:formate dehydrogenase accessory sulfurtransferase FdhD [Aliikangiella sp. G2MR2-5]|uniref:formate dehydrogenase accessory sulfurtransferase FdhD n=1 Tax=Aliikangiella sp. G2MR2-5 TaxID=2788943 RepID=UPI0018AA3DE0|nr:formate dehydrogenase accessory sulfurtransferase FdhD [Aliikangiella sp. G2MR2-5]
MTFDGKLGQQAVLNRFRVDNSGINLSRDKVGVEEPLQISLSHQGNSEVFSLTMRTPGHDTELVYGLLFSEGVIRHAEDILRLSTPELKAELEVEQKGNLIEAAIDDKVTLDIPKISRRLTSYSGCGLCGKTSLQALELKQSRAMKPVATLLSVDLVRELKSLLARQPLFSDTGGVHAAGLVYEKNGCLEIDDSPFFEDVGRHNALDKLIGFELLQNDLLQSGILVLSGRIGFELVQKAVMAGFSTIVALGAPSNLAIQAANQFDMVLVGFAKDKQFNLYTSHRQKVEVGMKSE